MMFGGGGSCQEKAALHMMSGKRKKYSVVNFIVEVSLPLCGAAVSIDRMSQLYHYVFKTAAKKIGE